MNPWDNVSVWKNEKEFLQWLRSQTRRIWARHPIKISYKQSRRFKAPKGRNGKDVWSTTCEMCNNVIRSSDAQVDHITPGGSFTNWEEYTQWAKRVLWVGWDDIRELCPSCHKIVNHQQKTGLSFEEAKLEKEIIEKTNQPIEKQKRELLAAGYEDISNKTKRRKAYKQWLTSRR